MLMSIPLRSALVVAERGAGEPGADQPGAQAKAFFQRPITIRVGTRGSARGVSDASVFFSTRFTADDK